MSAARRYLSRPRTKLYDYNYTMGERMYRGMVDSLDQPRGSRTEASAPSTPTYTKSSLPPPAPSSFSKPRYSQDRELSEEDDTIRKIRAARAKMEEEVRTFEEGSNKRRAALRSNNRVEVSDRLLDSVGIRKSAENGDYDYSARTRRAVTELEEDPFFTKKTFRSKFELDDDEDVPLPRIKSKPRNSHVVVEGDDYDTKAALDRAKKSRARLAEIDDEMEMLESKSKERSSRIASARALLKEASEVESSASCQQTVRMKRIQVTERVG